MSSILEPSSESRITNGSVRVQPGKDVSAVTKLMQHFCYLIIRSFASFMGRYKAVNRPPWAVWRKYFSQIFRAYKSASRENNIWISGKIFETSICYTYVYPAEVMERGACIRGMLDREMIAIMFLTDL